METFSDYNNLIIDIGACTCKSGLSSEIIKKNKTDNQSSDYYTLKSGYCSHDDDEEIPIFHTKEEWQNCPKRSKFKYPLKLQPEDYYYEFPKYYDFDDYDNYLGLGSHRDFLYHIYDFLFSHFKNYLEYKNVLLTEKGFIPNIYKKIDAEIMFEEFHVENLYIANIGALNLLSQGKSTGVSIDIGYTTAQIIPVLDGCKIGTNMSLNCSSKDIDTYLLEEYNKMGGKSITSFERYRETNCCSFDINCELVQPYIEGKIFRSQFLKSPEVIFNHNLNKNSSYGVVEGLIKSIINCDEDTKKELYGSICLSGDITSINGFESRFIEEIKQQLKAFNETNFINDINIIAPKNRNYLALIGGAILSETLSISNWVSKKEYDEMGSNIVLRKCF